MSQYRKKPVVIEAEPFDPVSLPLPFSRRGDPVQFNGVKWIIETLEGNHECIPGDMVIRGVKGEFYPCKPDIFAATYDPMEAKSDAGEPWTEADGLRQEVEMWQGKYVDMKRRRDTLLETRPAPAANTEGLRDMLMSHSAIRNVIRREFGLTNGDYDELCSQIEAEAKARKSAFSDAALRGAGGGTP